MNVDRTEAAAAYQWPADWQCDVHCLLQEGEGHRLTGFLHASRMNGHLWLQTPALWNNNHIPSASVEASGHCFAAMHIWSCEGPVHAGSIFFGWGFCLWVCNGTRTDWMDVKKTLWIKRQQPEDERPMMRCLTVCVKKDRLYFHLEKNKNKLLDVLLPRGSNLWRLIYCFSGTRFPFFVFYIEL